MENIKEERRDLFFWLKVLLYIGVVCSLGFFAFNQAYQFFYGAQLLMTPCDLCMELNPEVKECIDYLNQPRPSYWVGGKEGWSDPFVQPLNISIEFP